MKTNEYEITSDDIKLAERMHEARQKGLYFETRAVTSLYNKLYHTNLTATNCGSCIRKRIDGIWKKIQELKELTEPTKETTEPKPQPIIEPKQETNVRKEINQDSGENAIKVKKRVTKKPTKV